MASQNIEKFLNFKEHYDVIIIFQKNIYLNFTKLVNMKGNKDIHVHYC